jgi:hypothetical protein
MKGRAIDVGVILEKLYANEYFEQKYTDILMEMLIDIPDYFQDRIPAGLPNEVKSAHKVGQIYNGVEGDGSNMTYADSGIVFGEENKFVIVVMNQNIFGVGAIRKIQEITRLFYEYLN